MKRWRQPGMLAHMVQRVTGVGLLIYLLLHVRTIHKLSEGPQAFNEALAFFRSPFFKMAEIALLGAVILHALNGIRLTLLDLGIAHQRQRAFWKWSLGAGLALFLLGAAPIFFFAIWKAA